MVVFHKARVTGWGVDLAALRFAEPATVRAMYQALVEQIPAVLYINGPGADAETFYVSPQTLPILGLTAQDWFDDVWSTRVHPDDASAVSDNYRRFIAEESVGVDEYRFIRPDGQQIWIHDRVQIIRDEHGRPTLVQGVMFDITDRKRAEEALAGQARQLARIEEVGRSFSEALLRGDDITGLLLVLAGIVGNPVAFADQAHQLIAYADAGAGLPGVIGLWPGHARLPHPGGVIADVCRCAPVRVRDQEWGTVHILELGRTGDEVDTAALDRACAAIGQWLLSRQEAGRLADTARSEALAEVWQGRRADAADLLARFRSLGVDLRSPDLVAHAVQLRPENLRRAEAEALLVALRRVVADSGSPGLVARVGETFFLVGSGPFDAVHPTTVGVLPDRVVSVGISRSLPVAELRKALTEADEAASHGHRLGGRGGVVRAEDLGLRLLLATLADGPALSRFVEDELGPLLAHDSTMRIPLVSTLRAYLAAGGNKATAATSLHLERRSLYYRLARIESLLGRSLSDPGTRLRLEVALQGLDVLHARTP